MPINQGRIAMAVKAVITLFSSIFIVWLLIYSTWFILFTFKHTLFTAIKNTIKFIAPTYVETETVKLKKQVDI